MGHEKALAVLILGITAFVALASMPSAWWTRAGNTIFSIGCIGWGFAVVWAVIEVLK